MLLRKSAYGSVYSVYCLLVYPHQRHVERFYFIAYIIRCVYIYYIGNGYIKLDP